MRLIGNYKDWLTERIVNHFSTHMGDIVPVWQPERWKGHPLLEAGLESVRAGYSDNKHFFQQFNTRTPDMQGFDMELPRLPDDDRHALWWVIKLLPGQMQPMHFDPHLLDSGIKNPKRYTLFFQDYKPGHIFNYEDKIISNYKSGDMYLWDDPMVYHGVVNIAHDTRYTLQITTYDR
jgi:hypothetical protein